MKRYLLLLLLAVYCMPDFGQGIPDQATLKARAPGKFTAKFITTKGDFIVEVNREWSPEGADRLYQLIVTGFYTQNSLFRVQHAFVVQFGIGNYKEVNYFWDKRPIADEPVKTSNLKGTISYARDGMHSRTTQLFINRKDNIKLDTVDFNGLRGFPPVAKVISGFEVVEALFGGYGFEPANYQDSVMVHGNAYLKKKFPDLDYIIEVRVVTE
jgi:cyclophilin family peptidyl-prolyl cis-trans isomerase